MNVVNKMTPLIQNVAKNKYNIMETLLNEFSIIQNAMQKRTAICQFSIAQMAER